MTPAEIRAMIAKVIAKVIAEHGCHPRYWISGAQAHCACGEWKGPEHRGHEEKFDRSIIYLEHGDHVSELIEEAMKNHLYVVGGGAKMPRPRPPMTAEEVVDAVFAKGNSVTVTNVPPSPQISYAEWLDKIKQHSDEYLEAFRNEGTEKKRAAEVAELTAEVEKIAKEQREAHEREARKEARRKFVEDQAKNGWVAQPGDRYCTQQEFEKAYESVMARNPSLRPQPIVDESDGVPPKNTLRDALIEKATSMGCFQRGDALTRTNEELQDAINAEEACARFLSKVESLATPEAREAAWSRLRHSMYPPTPREESKRYDQHR